MSGNLCTLLRLKRFWREPVICLYASCSCACRLLSSFLRTRSFCGVAEPEELMECPLFSGSSHWGNKGFSVERIPFSGDFSKKWSGIINS